MIRCSLTFLTDIIILANTAFISDASEGKHVTVVTFNILMDFIILLRFQTRTRYLCLFFFINVNLFFLTMFNFLTLFNLFILLNYLDALIFM